MSYLVVGISHRSAAIDVLERVALDAEAATKLALAVGSSASQFGASSLSRDMAEATSLLEH